MRTASRLVTIVLLLVLCSSCTRSSVRFDAPRTAHAERIEGLRQQLAAAQDERQAAQEAFAEAMRQGTSQSNPEKHLAPEDARVYEQLDTVVDLLMLSPEMPLKEAIEIMRASVEPPLNIIVLWKDLADNADLKPDTPIDMDGLVKVRLSLALRRLLDAVAGGLMELDYVVDGGVVTVATVDSLPTRRMVTRVYSVPAALRAAGSTGLLILAIQEGTDPESWFELNDMGEGSITPCGEKLVVLQEPEVHRHIQQLLDAMSSQVTVMLPIEASPETLAERIRLVQPYVDSLLGPSAQEERARMLAPELNRIVNNLEGIRYQITRTDSDLPQLHQLTAIIDHLRAYLERYRTPGYDLGIGSNDFGPSLAFSQPTATEVAFRDVQRRIDAIHSRLSGPEFFDPEVHQIQLAARRLKLAQNRVHDLHVQIADLSAPAAASAEDDCP